MKPNTHNINWKAVLPCVFLVFAAGFVVGRLTALSPASIDDVKIDNGSLSIIVEVQGMSQSAVEAKAMEWLQEREPGATPFFVTSSKGSLDWWTVTGDYGIVIENATLDKPERSCLGIFSFRINGLTGKLDNESHTSRYFNC